MYEWLTTIKTRFNPNILSFAAGWIKSDKLAKHTSRVFAFAKQQWLNLAIIFIVTIASFSILAPKDAFADMIERPTSQERKAVGLMVASMHNELEAHGAFPESDLRGPFYTTSIVATAYSSEPWQTDDTPFITASGTHVRHGVVASNYFPIGTRIKIPEIYGDDIFIVEDRMNKRYNKRLDIWMSDTQDARIFGVKEINIEVYPIQ